MVYQGGINNKSDEFYLKFIGKTRPTYYLHAIYSPEKVLTLAISRNFYRTNNCTVCRLFCSNTTSLPADCCAMAWGV
jgi:hypothetical protein